MDTKTVSIFFKVGHFFALTPPSHSAKVPNLHQKARQVFTLLFYTFGLIYNIYARRYLYEHVSPVQKLFRIIMDIDLYAHTYHSLINVMIFKRRNLLQLCRNLYISGLKMGPTKNYFWIFVITHLIFCASLSVITYAWNTIVGAYFFKMYLVELFQFYIIFFYTFFGCTLLDMVLQRYRFQKALLLETQLNKHDNDQRFNNIRNYLSTLKENIDIFNEIFGWTILLLIFFAVVKALIYVDIVLKNTYSSFNVTTSTLHFVANINVIFQLWVSKF